MPLSWIFDPPPPSGAQSGGNPALYVFEADERTFVREVLQNALDQRHRDETVRVDLTIQDLRGAQLDEALAAVSWVDLSPHLAGVCEGDALIAGALSGALGRLDAGSLRIVRIDDCGTMGLRGAEDDAAENFAALTKNILVTSEERGSRGGSYGLGKAVLWRFSALRTVLFISDVAGPNGLRRRTFGRTEIPFHQTSNHRWAGPGFFGTRESVDSFERAESVFTDIDAGPFAGTPFDRPLGCGVGTSIVILDFQPPALDPSASVDAITEHLLEAAAESFWPAMDRDILEFSVRHDDVTFPVEYSEKVALFSGSLRGGNDVVEKRFDVRVPPLIGESEEPVGSAKVFVRSGVDRREAGNLVNTLAVQRGTGMVLTYHEPRIPLLDEPYVGVVLVGEAAGDTPEDRAVEAFLRAAEPPAHHDWTHSTDRVRSRYRQGAGARLKEFWDGIRDTVQSCVNVDVQPSNEGPDRLRRLFRIGGPPRPPKPRFRVTFTGHDRREDGWSVSGLVARTDDAQGPWEIDFRLCLDAEGGQGDVLDIVRLVTEPELTSTDGGQGRVSVDVPVAVTEVTFELETGAPDDVVAARAVMRADVVPKEIH